jgi:hypothetical protein
MSGWISAKEASKRIKDAGLTEGDLIEWARLGKLSTRAESGTFSSDEPPEKRIFPNGPPSNEAELFVAGSWPDIFSGFWQETPIKALWGPGTFKGRVNFWNDHYQSNDCEIIELFGVKFNKCDLEALLSGSTEPTTSSNMPQKRWQKKRVTPRQAAAMRFMDIITRTPPKDLEGKSDRHRRYCVWHEKEFASQENKALGRTDFNECASRYEDGWRVSGMRWVENP